MLYIYMGKYLTDGKQILSPPCQQPNTQLLMLCGLISK
jgi:hypothetical protein